MVSNGILNNMFTEQLSRLDIQMIAVCGRVLKRPLQGYSQRGDELFYNYNPLFDAAQTLELIKKLKLTMGFDMTSKYISLPEQPNSKIRYQSDGTLGALTRAVVTCVYTAYKADHDGK